MEDNKFLKEDRYLRAEKKVKQIKGFYGHLFWYLAVNLFIIGISIANNDWNFNILLRWDIYSTAFFWGIGLFFHWFGVFGKNKFFSKNWEDRKMKEYMDNDKF